MAYLRVRILWVNESVDVLDAAVHADDQQESWTGRKGRAGQGRACILNGIPHEDEYTY